MSRRYKRYRKRNYRSRSRRPWYSARNMKSYAGTALTALKIARQVKAMVNVEYKTIDTDISTTTASAGTIECINLCAQGDGLTNRDGQQIKMVSIQLSFTISAVTGSTVGSFVRCILLLCTHQDDTDPTVTGDEGVLTTATIYGLRNITTTGTTRNRYVTLWDKTYNMSPIGEVGATKMVKFYKKKVLKSVYQGTTANTAPSKNSLYFLAITNAGTYHPEIAGFSRIRFIDN